MIIETEPVNSNLCQVVLYLGSFYMEMSFIGSIGHLMAESWLKEFLELITKAIAYNSRKSSSPP